ncbi:MAG: hypothetical protein MJB57_12330 [Gemmatimonadetes bacterium]|nr:hypothetical protein [Gemmatimonadota bacterium]
MSQKKSDRKDTTEGGRPASTARAFGFGVSNYAIFIAGVGSIVLGYVLLDRGSVTAAPLFLIFGYAVLLPVGLMLGWRRLG